MFCFRGGKKDSEICARQATSEALLISIRKPQKQPAAGSREKHEFPGFCYSFLDNLTCERKSRSGK
jgi:hypothetical protein